MNAQRKLHFLIISDDKTAASFYAKILEQTEQYVSKTSFKEVDISHVIKDPPDCVLLDIKALTRRKMSLIKHFREQRIGKQSTLIIIADKSFKVSVDGFLKKPINPKTFIEDVFDIIDNRMTVRFWGIRGTLPVPGKKTTRYGGNTNCVTLSIGKHECLIFDAGTGIKELSNYLVTENKLPIKARIFITHPHFDHIQGIPFFVPLYQKGNTFDVYGTTHEHLNIEQSLGSQMDNIHFPVTMKEFSANIHFHDLKEEAIKIDDIDVKTILLTHPGGSIGYRVDFRGKSFCYITDNEIFLENSPQYDPEKIENLINFIYKADVLVMDATYFDEEYTKKIGWGHASLTRVIDVSDRAKVKLLCLYHHDPDQFDNDIDLKLKLARTLLKSRKSKTLCIAPREGDKIDI